MQIHAAARRGDIDGIRYCLSRGTPVDARDTLNNTPLLAALESLRAFERRCAPRPDFETIEFLLEAGADVNAAGELGDTPAHSATQTGSLEILQLIEARGGDLLHITKHGYTTAVHACYQPPSAAKLAMLRHLALRGVSLDRATEYGESPLSVCLYFGDFAAMRLLLSLGANPAVLGWSALHHALVVDPVAARALHPSAAELEREIPDWKLTPLLLAIKLGDLESVAWLAGLGADWQAVGRCGARSLHLAAKQDHVAVLEWLLDLGADIETKDDTDSTPLAEACENDSLRCIAALLQRGASTQAADHVSMRPIHHAKTLGALKLLVEMGEADVNVVDGCGEWPLKCAAEDNDLARIEWLLAHGAHVDSTSTGDTALHAAVKSDSREAARLLLDRGADVNAQDVDGWTSLFSVRSRELTALLLDRGADPSISDQCDGTPAQWIKDPLILEVLTETRRTPPK